MGNRPEVDALDENSYGSLSEDEYSAPFGKTKSYESSIYLEYKVENSVTGETVFSNSLNKVALTVSSDWEKTKKTIEFKDPFNAVEEDLFVHERSNVFVFSCSEFPSSFSVAFHFYTNYTRIEDEKTFYHSKAYYGVLKLSHHDFESSEEKEEEEEGENEVYFRIEFDRGHCYGDPGRFVDPKSGRTMKKRWDFDSPGFKGEKKKRCLKSISWVRKDVV